MDDFGPQLIWLAAVVGGVAFFVVGVARSRRTSVQRAVTSLALMALLSWGTIAASGRLVEWAVGMWITATWLVGARILLRRPVGNRDAGFRAI